MTRFAYLDSLILKALDGRPTTFSALSVQPAIFQESERLAIPDRLGCTQPFRVVDRRLQAMRKAGKLKVSRKSGWELA